MVGAVLTESHQHALAQLCTSPMRQVCMLPAEPNYAYGGGTPTNVNSPQQAAALWPYIVGNFSSLGIALLAPSAINCAYPSDANCRYVGTITGWLNAFKAVSPSYHSTADKTNLSLSNVWLGLNVCCCFGQPGIILGFSFN